MTEPEMLVLRVEALEKYIQQSAKKVEADQRLADGIERLAVETGGLNAVLTKVDEQQQALARTNRRLEAVDKKIVPREELEKKERERAEEAAALRRKVVRRSIGTGVGLGLLLLLGLAGLAEYERYQDSEGIRQCRERNVGALKVKAYVAEQIAITRTNPVLPDDLRAREIAALETLGESFPVVDCNNDGVRE